MQAAAAADSSPAGDASPPPAARPCTSELSLRDAGRTASASGTGTVLALRNRGASPCTVSGNIGVRLYGTDGKLIPLRFGPNELILTFVTLAPGEEASFTLAVAPPDPAECTSASRIEVFFPGRPGPLETTTAIAACPGERATLSRLRPGVPLTRASLPFA